MHRVILWCCLVVGLLMPTAATAQDQLRPSRARQREIVEAILAQPVDWKPKDPKAITIDQFIDHVRDRFGLAIRWDAASVQMLGADGGSLLGQANPPAPRAALTDNTATPSPYPQPGAPAAPAYNPTYALRTYDPLTSAPDVPERLRPHITQFGPPTTSDPNKATPPSPIPADAPPSLLEPVPPPGAPPAPYSALPAAAPVETQEKKKPAAQTEEHSEGAEDEPQPHQVLSARALAPSTIALEGATVGEALEQLLAAALPPIVGAADELEIGVPVSIRALTLDYLIDGRSVVITTRLRANAVKETRVYRISHLKGLPPEQLAKTICHSIRPWSWRSQASEIADRLAARFPKGSLNLPSVATATAYLPEGVVVAASESSAPTPAPTPAVTADDLAGLGQLLTGGAIAAVEAIVNTVEIVHYGDPPTGVMEVLPGVLVITQSQGAHREIAALLEELGKQAQ